MKLLRKCATTLAIFAFLLQTTSVFAATWTELLPQGSSQSNVWRAVALDDDGSNLIIAAQNVDIYTSNDSGVTWAYPSPAGSNQSWYAADSDADGSNLIAAVTGGRLWTSSNGGVDWTERRPAGDANKFWGFVASDADGSNLIIGEGFGGRLCTWEGSSLW